MQLHASNSRAEAGVSLHANCQQHGSGRLRFEIQAELDVLSFFRARAGVQLAGIMIFPPRNRRSGARLECLRLCSPETGLIRPWPSAVRSTPEIEPSPCTWPLFARQHHYLENHRTLAIAIVMRLAHSDGPKQVIRRRGA